LLVRSVRQADLLDRLGIELPQRLTISKPLQNQLV
jgi:hypothetical protein